jgi:signal transduction histidine kinase
MLQNARLKQLHIDQKISDNLHVYADSNHVKLILRNLLSNAIKFSHSQGVIEIEAGKNGDGMVELKVKDCGVGMTETSLKQLFRSETLLTKRGTQNEVGTGLGLVLCKEFLEKNNGKISVASEEGKGSCFTISLPSTA